MVRISDCEPAELLNILKEKIGDLLDKWKAVEADRRNKTDLASTENMRTFYRSQANALKLCISELTEIVDDYSS